MLTYYEMHPSKGRYDVRTLNRLVNRGQHWHPTKGSSYFMQNKPEKGAKHRLEGVPTRMGSLFIDSGAHSLYNREVDGKGPKRTDPTSMSKKYEFFDLRKGSEFRGFLEDYVAFIKEHGKNVDYYVTLDAIYHPEKTWEITCFLEDEYGLKPVPVVHCHASLKWIAKYIERGHRFIGIGGLGQGITKDAFLGWGDKVFNFICQGPGRQPVVRTHGFAMTSHELMLRYPWWSVDSASWLKAAAYGQIYVPPKRRGEFVFTEAPYVISASHESPNQKEKGKHLNVLKKSAPKTWATMMEWLVDVIGVPLGKKSDDGEVIKWGVRSHLEARARANLLYFHALGASLPYPRPFEVQRSIASFGLIDHGAASGAKGVKSEKLPDKNSHIYFSGLSGGGVYPEVLIHEKSPDVMLSFDNLRAKTEGNTAWRRFHVKSKR